MRRALFVTLLSACGFSVQGQTPGTDDAARDSAGGEATPTDGARTDVMIDAMVDAGVDMMIDARQCPDPPAGCSAFSCAGSSHCYYDCQGEPDRWSDAQAACEVLGGCLVTINDAAENQCIDDNASTSTWIGWVQDTNGSEPAGGWHWQCGSSSFVDPEWDSGDGGEPNNFGGSEDCGALTSDGSWNDSPCGNALRWMCEVP